MRAAAIGIDLGSTFVKAGLLGADGQLQHVRALPAPPLAGAGAIREGDATEWIVVARRLLDSYGADLPRGIPLGLASQRSSFTIWNRSDGRLLLPLISWQDRRAASWCEAHRDLAAMVARRTGLLLSAHYAGPKLAMLIESRPELAAALRSGGACFGTLETLLLHHWTAGRVHETDLTIAARTAMLDLDRGTWCPELLSAYGVPAGSLPHVVASEQRGVALDVGPTLVASLGDQAAGALAVCEDEDTTLVNLGTGCFVLRPGARYGGARPGYLVGPILGSAQGPHRFAVEGPINGGGSVLDRYGAGPIDLPEADPAPTAFAIPDLAGLGAPHWRPDIGLTLSPAAEALAPAEQRRIVLEGLLFRIREVIDDLGGEVPARRIVLAGGLAREAAIAEGLAAVLMRPVEVLEEQEAVLVGAARLAAGLAPYAAPRCRTVEAAGRGAYLNEKYDRWRAWHHSAIGAPSAGP